MAESSMWNYLLMSLRNDQFVFVISLPRLTNTELFGKVHTLI